MNSKFNLVYLIIVFICVIIVAYIITPIFLPDPKKLKLHSADKVPYPKNFVDYLNNIYKDTKKKSNLHYETECINEITSVINIDHNFNPEDPLNPKSMKKSITSGLRYFNFIWETAPDSILNLFETAKNTTVEWPPKYNQKYRLLAFPYVSGNIFSGLYQTLSNKSSVATMPSWYLSKYDPIDYSNSLYNKIFDSKIVNQVSVSDKEDTISQYKVLTTFWGKVVEYETTPILRKYIDSSNEENLFTGKYKTGGYILESDYISIQNFIHNGNLAWDEVQLTKHILTKNNPYKPNNKYYLEVQHTCYPMPGYDYPYCDDGGWWTYLSVGCGIYWNANRPIICKNKLHLLHCCGWTLDQFVDIVIGYGGGNNLVNAVFRKIYNDEHPKNQKPNVGLGFRIMNGKNGDVVVRKFFLNIILFFFIIIYLIILIFKDLFELFKNLKDKLNTVTKITLISIYMIIIFTLIWYLIHVALNDFFKGLGWRTLDMALEETNMTTHQFFEEAIHGTNSNPICNGLNMTEWFDSFLYKAVIDKGFTSAIMTMQPNKSGCWMVEMFDITNYVTAKTNITPKLGICGEQKLQSGIKKAIHDKSYISQIMGTIPSNDDCGNSKVESGCGNDKLDNSGKQCNIYGCRDTNHALCMSCDAVPLSNICISNKKIDYSS